jgi:hypothetical protein
MFLRYLIFLDIKSIFSEIFILVLPNTFGRMIQLDSADSPLSIS